ncbi:MAG: DUF998 domain-containing protein [Bacilli bacterium]|nr:DUF998 domain-containing protein [Bacilli bacterium]
MKEKRKISDFRYLLYAFIVLILVIFILPSFSVETYSIIKNTTSHLGAQNAVNAWIMNVTFILVGISCVLEAWLHLQKYWFHKILLSVFGLALVFTGVFRHAPIIEGVIFNPLEDKLHSVFATIVGISFTIYAVSSAFIEKAIKHRIIDIIVGFTATSLSMLMICLPDLFGIWQRSIFIVSFVWLIFMLERIRDFNKTV